MQDNLILLKVPADDSISISIFCFSLSFLNKFIFYLQLQISRSDTIIGPLKTPLKQPVTKVPPMQRYANFRNPTNNSKPGEGKVRLSQPVQRHVSIPGGRAPTQGQEQSDTLNVKGSTSSTTKYSGSVSWREKSDMDRVKRAGTPKSPPASVHSSNCMDFSDTGITPMNLVNAIKDIVNEEEGAVTYRGQNSSHEQGAVTYRGQNSSHEQNKNQTGDQSSRDSLVNGALVSTKIFHKSHSELGQMVKKPAPITQVS